MYNEWSNKKWWEPMEFLLNPNVAYLLLVSGLVVAVLALVTPGTGVLELVAFSVLALSGWIISQLEFNWIALVLLIVGVFPFLLALRKTQRLLFLFLALVAASVGSTFLFVSQGWRPVVHPALAILVNLLLVGFFWIVVKKGMEAIQSKPLHTMEGLVGMTGETRTEVYREGSIYLRGEMWSAYSQEPIPAHRKVKIINRQGLILEVQEAEKPVEK
jgi:membrane-bound serine protease (ClpP class)